MRRARPLKSKLRSNANQLNLLFDTSKPIVTPFGMDVAQFKKTVTPEKKGTELKKKQNKQYRHLCLSERNMIGSMIKQGLCLAAVARQLKRGKQTIAEEVNRNGGRDAYDPVAAHAASMKRKASRDMKLSLSLKYKEFKPDENLLQRLENLEMQVEILSETIKEVTRERSKTNYRL